MFYKGFEVDDNDGHFVDNFYGDKDDTSGLSKGSSDDYPFLINSYFKNLDLSEHGMFYKIFGDIVKNIVLLQKFRLFIIDESN